MTGPESRGLGPRRVEKTVVLGAPGSPGDAGTERFALSDHTVWCAANAVRKGPADIDPEFPAIGHETVDTRLRTSDSRRQPDEDQSG